MKTTTFISLDEELRKFFNSKKTEDTCNLLRSAVVDSSNLITDLLEPNGLVLKPSNLKEKILLGLFQWYCPKEIGCLINLYLEENWGADYEEMKICLLSSKELALGAILECRKWSDRDFFGNILKEENWKFFFRSRVRRRVRRAPRKLVRRRGYNDHGTLRLPHESEPSYDSKKLLSVVELEERREVQRQLNLEFRRKVLNRLTSEGIVA
jgi:hypothetical protein